MCESRFYKLQSGIQNGCISDLHNLFFFFLKDLGVFRKLQGLFRKPQSLLEKHQDLFKNTEDEIFVILRIINGRFLCQNKILILTCVSNSNNRKKCVKNATLGF
ncbi:hypothetical protein DW683_18360 [Bacteroides sp. AM25-34]|nr:hypothetical protein DW683_18360 [Bacteroides sp. AM25-34]